MALAVHASTPARASGVATNGTVAITTATFDPPAAVLVATVQANVRDVGGTGIATCAITNNGSGLTWTAAGERSLSDGGGNSGFAGIYVAVLGSSRTGMTVTATFTSSTGFPNDINSPSIKLYVVTGADTADPVGAVAEGSSATNNLTTTAFTAEVDASLGFASASEWNALGAPVSADIAYDSFHNGSSIDGVSGYKALAGAGTSATFNLDAGGSGTPAWNWVTVEIKPAAQTGVYKVADVGVLANTTAATTAVVDLPAGSTIATGNYLIVRLAVDNSGTSGAATTLTVTDTASNTWTNLGPANQDPGGAEAGMTCYIAYAKVVNAISDGHDVTATFGNSTSCKAIVVEEWTGIHATTPIAVSATTAAGSSAPSVARTPTAAGQLVYGALATEGPRTDTFTDDTDTTDGSWVSATRLGTDSGSTSVNAVTAGQYKVVTGTSAQTWNPTITARDFGAILVVFDAAPSNSAAASLGGLTSSATAVVTVSATADSPLGGLAATATAVVSHGGTFATTLGGLSAAATAGVTHPAAATATLDGLTAAAIADPILHDTATAVADLGFTAVAVGDVSHDATADAPLGFAATAIAGRETAGTMAAPLGSLSAAVAATADHPAAATSTLAGLAAAAAGVVTHGATAAAVLGELSGAAFAVGSGEALATAALGGLTGASAASVTHPAAAAADLGSAAAAVSGTVDHPTTAAANLGGLTSTSALTVTHPAAATATLGELVAAALADTTVNAQAAVALGGLAAAAFGGAPVDGVAAAALGQLAATAIGSLGNPPPAVPPIGGAVSFGPTLRAGTPVTDSTIRAGTPVFA